MNVSGNVDYKSGNLQPFWKKETGGYYISKMRRKRS